MPSTCTFEFDRPVPVYYSGETINGRIVLYTTTEKSVRDISIYFEGYAKVRWTETRTERRDGKDHTYTDHYRGDETYISSKTFIMGEGILPVGTHVYTFCIPLPLECPTSCVEKHGKICYEVKLVLNRPLRFDNNFVQPLTVLHQTDLNLDPMYLWPLKSEDIKYFCCWPCSSGPVISTLTIPFSGYAPGQDICYKLEIDNQSKGYDLEGLTVKLIQRYTFTAHYPHRKSRNISNTLARLEQGDRVLRLSKRIVEGKLSIPPVPPTSPGSGIIQVVYFVEMTIQTGCCSINPEIEVPLTIGTIPLWQSATQPDSVQVMQPSAPDTPGAGPMDQPPGYDICKPPTFEEATGVGEKFVDTDVDPHAPQIGWAPKYPMYSNFATPSSYRGGAQNSIDAAEQIQNEARPLLNAAPYAPHVPSYPSAPSAPFAPQGNPMLPYPAMGGMPGLPQPEQRETYRM